MTAKHSRSNTSTSWTGKNLPGNLIKVPVWNDSATLVCAGRYPGLIKSEIVAEASSAVKPLLSIQLGVRGYDHGQSIGPG